MEDGQPREAAPPGVARQNPILQVFDRGVVSDLVMGANDGIMATGGIVEGFSAAAAAGQTLVLAAIVSLTIGALSLGGAMYTDYAARRDAATATVEEERRRLATAPDVELAALERLYIERGVTPEVAKQVAIQLSAHDALGAHIEVEYGIQPEDLSINPAVVGVASAIAFAAGAMIPVLAALFAPPEWRLVVIIVAAGVALCVTSTVLVRVGKSKAVRTFVRSLCIGIGTILIGLGAGRLLG